LGDAPSFEFPPPFFPSELERTTTMTMSDPQLTCVAGRWVAMSNLPRGPRGDDPRPSKLQLYFICIVLNVDMDIRDKSKLKKSNVAPLGAKGHGGNGVGQK
jgi:hypothetical protein